MSAVREIKWTQAFIFDRGGLLTSCWLSKRVIDLWKVLWLWCAEKSLFPLISYGCPSWFLDIAVQMNFYQLKLHRLADSSSKSDRSPVKTVMKSNEWISKGLCMYTRYYCCLTISHSEYKSQHPKNS